MIRYLLLLALGFLGALLTRNGLRAAPDAAPTTAGNDAMPIRAIDAPALSEIERLLALTRHTSRTPAQVRELQRAIDHWLLADPEACIAWLQDRKATGLIREDLLPSVCAFRFGGRMSEVMRATARISDPLLHYAFISAGFQTAAEMHPAEAFEALAGLPYAKRRKLGPYLISRWAHKDPRNAWEAASTSNLLEVRELAAYCMMAWSWKHPEDLQEYLHGQIARPNNWSALEAGLGALIGSDRTDAILQLLAGRERHSRMQSFWDRALQEAVQGNLAPDRALQLAKKEPAGTRRNSALLTVAIGYLRSEKPERAAKIVDELSPDKRREFERVRPYRSMSYEPSRVPAFVESLPDEFSKFTAMSHYVHATLRHSAQALVEMALNASSPERGPDWLDMVALELYTNPGTSKSGDAEWIEKLDAQTRERLGPELQRRLTAADWGRLQSHFQKVPR